MTHVERRAESKARFICHTLSRTLWPVISLIFFILLFLSPSYPTDIGYFFLFYQSPGVCVFCADFLSLLFGWARHVVLNGTISETFLFSCLETFDMLPRLPQTHRRAHGVYGVPRDLGTPENGGIVESGAM